MKKTVFLLILAWLSGRSAQAATYYFAAGGDDSRTAVQAQNPATPWQSIAKLNASMPLLQPGDQVLFRRGDVFRGALVITRSGSAGNLLTFGAYGAATDALPVLNASAPLSGWKSVGTNLWEAPCPSSGPTVTGVYAVGGRALPLGRYPNLSAPKKGYLTISSHQGKTQLTGAALAGSWVGGEAVVRSQRWILDRAPITAQSGTTLTIDNASSAYEPKDGWGFFIQNHPATLDQPGEWYFDAANKKIRLYATAAPADGAIEATMAAPAGVRIDFQQYVVLENLTLTRSYQFGLDAQDASHCIVRGVRVLDAGQNGVRLYGTGADVLLENNLIQNVNNNGLEIGGYDDITLRGNVVRAIGLVAGRGRSGDGNYFSFNIFAANRVLVQSNTLDSLGYLGLSYSTANNITIERNLVSNFCLTKDDGGGIYTWNGVQANNINGRILNNIVLKGLGASDGTDDQGTNTFANGIYLDLCTQNLEISGNTVAGCAARGIFLGGNRDIVVRDNTCFDNGTQLSILAAGLCDNTRFTIERNVLVSADPGKRVASYAVSPAILAQLGTFGSNYYVRPFAEVSKLRAGPRDYQLADWQAAFGYDAGSRDSPVRFRPYRVDARLGNQLLTNGTFTDGTTDWNAFSTAGNGRQVRDETNYLGSGNSLRLSFVGNSGKDQQILTTEIKVGAVRPGQRFALRFRAACATGTKVVAVYLKRNSGDYGDLTLPVRVLLTPTATNYDFAFEANADDATPSLAFTVDEDANQTWLDDVDLRAATLTPASVADSIRFEYNATTAPRTVALPAGQRFVDVRSVAYSGSVTLAPFASVVLLRTNATTVTILPAKPTQSTARTASAALLWPNPSAGPATLDLRGFAAGSCQVELLDATGRAVRRLTLLAGRTHALELGGLPTGVFLLRVLGPGGQASQRVLRE